MCLGTYLNDSAINPITEGNATYIENYNRLVCGISRKTINDFI